MRAKKNTYDDRQPGLMLRTRPSGHKSYYFVYNHRGRTRWYHIGKIKLTDARRIAAKLRPEAVEGRDPAAERKAQRQAGTFGELASRYLDEHAKRRNKSWQQADYLVRTHLLPRWARLDAKAITRADVRTALGKISSPTVANQTRAAASAIFSFGVKMEVLPFNPVRGVDRNPTQSRERVLSDSELALFWPQLTSALKVLLFTGQRPGEILNMLREHIKDGWWEMPGKPDPKTNWPGTKNGKNHRVWLSGAVREIIGDGSSGRVFARTELDAEMRDICKRLQVEDKVTPHDLRRTFGTLVTRLTFGRPAMNRILNHRDRSVGTVYDRHAYATEDQRVMESVARHILEVAEGRKGTSAVIRVF
jgi:integrase